MSKIKAGTTSTTAYQVEADTTGTLVLQTGATPTTAMTIGSDQRVGIGTASPSSPLEVNGGILTVKTTTDVFDGYRYVNSPAGPAIFLSKSRSSTIGTNTIVQNGDTIGVIAFQPNYGSGFAQAASIGAYVDGTPSGISDLPTRLEFATSSDGTANNATRMVIYSNGQVTTPYQAAFSVRGNSTSSFAAGAKLLFTDDTTASSPQAVFDNGGFWDNANSWFTAPVSGYYLFNFQVYIQNALTAGQSIAILVNGAQLGATDTVMAFTNSSGGTSGAGGDQGSKGSIMLKLGAGDYVYLGVRVGANAINVYAGHSYFQGYLIG